MVLSRIFIYPIKSLDGVAVTESRITAGGILEHDRAYAIVDRDGSCINGKRNPRVHALRSHFDASFREVQLWENANTSTRTQFDLRNPGAINKWLSDFFGIQVKLVYEPQRGFPDDRTASGPTITSEGSLNEIQHWFPELTLESIRRRFRSNLEIGDPTPFCEDRLFGPPNELKSFRIGNIEFLGHNPCQRCVVPTREPESGEAVADFQKKFSELRQKHLSSWADASRFNHYYRFAVNTSIPTTEAGQILRVGDALHLS